MSEPTNKERAERAREVLKAYERLGGTRASEVETCSQDLITDLLHLLRREAGLSDQQHREDVLQRAAEMNLIEIREDPEDYL